MLLDYLCYNCKSCKKNLCKKHYHNEISCPFTDKMKIIYDKKLENKILNKANNINSECNFCNIVIYNNKGYECNYCKKNYCLKHRLEIDHKCKESSKKSISDLLLKNKNMIMDKLKNLKKK